MIKRRYSSEADPTRDRILRAAIDLVSSRSVGALSVRDVGAAAGVNVATVHYYFHTKDELFAEAFRVVYEPIKHRLEGLAVAATSTTTGTATDSGPRAVLEGFLAFFLQQFCEHPGIFVSVIETIIASSVRDDPAAAKAYEKLLLSIVGSGKDALIGLIGAVSGLDAGEDLAFTSLRLMMNIINPIIVSSHARDLFGVDFSDEATRRRYAARLVDSLPGRPRDQGNQGRMTERLPQGGD